VTRKRDRRRQRDDEAQGLAESGDVKHLTEQIAAAETLDAGSLRTLQRTAGNQAVLRLGPGKPLDPATRGRMEGAFRTSFADVRVHSGPESAALARGENAAAFAVGSDIVLGEAAGAPGTVAGDALLAHELAHVAQQRDAAETVQAKALGAAPDSALERDADRSAFQAISTLWGNVKQNAMPALKSGVQLARCPQTVETVSGTPGSTLSQDITVTIDEADRPVQGGPPEIEGSVSGVDDGVAQLFYTEAGEGCNEANAIELPFKVKVRNGQFKFKLPATTGLAGIGKWVMVKAGDGTNFNYACAQIQPEGGKAKLKVK
jgi:hypothetical protein